VSYSHCRKHLTYKNLAGKAP